MRIIKKAMSIFTNNVENINPIRNIRENKEYYLTKLLELFISKTAMRYKDGVSTLSGVEIINHFNLSSSEIDTFFNVFCLDLEIVMTINPGYDECSPDWRLNNYGLTESYFKQALRQVKIKELGI